MKQHAPATERNREAIGDVLERVLPAAGTVLEIASGTGEHAVAFARRFPALIWQPSDVDATSLASIRAWRADIGLPNLCEPIALDVHATTWPLETADAITCINMVHISPWSASLGLFAGAARLLPSGALLYLYGPYLIDGATAPSNLAFDRSLKSRDPRWGVRELRDLEAAATEFRLDDVVAMPANNHSLVFRRR